MKPQRIQRKRTKGWRMPDGAKYVGRPTKWGNPVKITDGKAYIMTEYRKWTLLDYSGYDMYAKENAVDFFRKIIEGPVIQYYFNNQAMYYWYRHFNNLDWNELKGWEYLACWCKLDQSCHVDVLIKKL